MKIKNPIRKVIISAALLPAVITNGCATRTRLGALIPAHHLSNQRSGEEVWMHVAPGKKAVGFIPLAALAVPLTTAAVGAAVDYVKGQLQQEAQLYDAQFSQKVWLDTVDLANAEPAEVLLTRWVDSPLLAGKPKDYDSTVVLVSNIVTTATVGSTTKMDPAAFAERTRNKSLAFAYCIQVAGSPHTATNPPVLIRPEWKWQWLSKAKIVSLRSGNPLSWPLGLLLHTDSSVETDVHLTVGSLINTSAGYAKMINVGIDDPIQDPEKFDLSGTKQFTDFKHEGSVFGWVALPSYPQSSNLGYLSIQMTVNESDPSNIKKTLQKGADYLDTNKTNIVNKVVGSL